MLEWVPIDTLCGQRPWDASTISGPGTWTACPGRVAAVPWPVIPASWVFSRSTLTMGRRLTYAWHFGVPLQMTSRITEMAAPDYFVDEQVRGPFRSFRHVHEFREDAGQTVMVDRIEFAAPFGPLGRLVEKLVLTRYLRKLIEQRSRHLTRAREQ